MSLISLRRCTSPVKKASVNKVTLDDFIEQANLYAECGHDSTNSHLTPVSNEDGSSVPMRRATFTLTEACIQKLSYLSQQSGHSRSKLIRHWILSHANTEI
jgi:hypothetical protein